MSLTRAFSKRMSSRDSTMTLARKRQSNAQPVKKGLISGPVELISSTNNLAYTAPSISDLRISTYSRREAPSSPESAGSPPPLTPDRDQSESGFTPPTTPPAEEEEPITFPLTSRSRSPSSSLDPVVEVKELPKRDPRRNRAGSSGSSEVPAVPPRSSSVTRQSTTSTTHVHRSMSSGALKQTAIELAIEPNTHGKKQSTGIHPFGKELAQVTELAEEMGLDLDEECMVQKGLFKFSVDEYLADLSDVVHIKGLFARQSAVQVGGAGWI